MTPKGKLIIIGGHEDKGEIAGENLTIHKKRESTSNFEILGTLILNIPRVHHVIEIIASASAIPEEMENLYINSYKQAGFTQVGFIRVESKEDGENPDLIKKIQTAHAVFFTGGDQKKLIASLADTKLLTAIKNKYYSDKNFIVAGTSAGAMVIPEIIITGGLIREALYKEDINIGKGFDLIKDVIVDTHFIKRGRIARLTHAVALHPSCLGIGLGEDTALIITEGNDVECIGSGMVVIIDGSKITATNINIADNSTPIFIENINISFLVEGNFYSLKDRKFYSK